MKAMFLRHTICYELYAVCRWPS